MPRRSIMIVTMLSSLICFTGFALGADDQHALIKSLGSAKISLQRTPLSCLCGCEGEVAEIGSLIRGAFRPEDE